MNMKRVNVETEENRPIMPIAIIPWRISVGSGSSELLVKPVVALVVDLIIGMDLSMSRLDDMSAILCECI
jgi:hypothetical protein